MEFAHASVMVEEAIELLVAVEGKAGARADQNSIGLFDPHEPIGKVHGLVQHEVEDLQSCIVDEEETDAGFVENRTDELLVGPERPGGCKGTRSVGPRRRWTTRWPGARGASR